MRYLAACLLVACVDLGPPSGARCVGPCVDAAQGGRGGARDAAVDRRPADDPRDGEAPRPDASPDMPRETPAPDLDPPRDGPPPDAPAPDAAPAKKRHGESCATATECASGFCVVGICCASSCTAQPESSCGLDGTCDGAGACRKHAPGTICAAAACAGSTETPARTCDGLGTCRPAQPRPCDPFVCQGARCGTTCAGGSDCVSGSFCDVAARTCAGKRPLGATCAQPSECGSGLCVDGVCCQTACGEPCHACNLPGAAGTCTPIAAGQDPANECAAEATSSCGRDGACDGRGGCRLHPAGTPCAGATCASGAATAARTCDGQGTCAAGTTSSCAPYAGCSGTACARTCADPDGCAVGHACSAGQCVSLATGLVAYWKLDESSVVSGTTTAADSAGGGLSARHVAASGNAVPQTDVPAALGFPDPRSLRLDMAGRQALQLSPMPAALKPEKTLTVSVWFKTTAKDTDGTVLVSGGDNWELLFWSATSVSFTKSHGGGWHICNGTVANALDGGWHHLVGVKDASGMRVYFDGVKRSSGTGDCADTQDILYNRGADLFIGRHGNGQTTYDLGGSVDDVRIWNRALSDAEIAALFAGK